MGGSEPRWMTYRALADELGISLRAAEARARRNVRMGRWRHRIDNEPPKAAQVLVAPADLEAMRGSTEGGTAPDTAGATAPRTTGGTAGNTASHAVGDTVGDTVPQGVLALVTELHQRAEAAEARTRDLAGELAAQRERAGRAEGERAALQEALRAAQAATEGANRRARIAEERAAEVTTIMGRVAKGLEHVWQTQTTAAGAITGAVAAAKAEREAALAKVKEAAQRAGEAEARAVDASRRAEAAEARLDELQRLPAEANTPDPAELEAARARATEAEKQAAEARRRADEAERRATTANERWDRFQQRRIAEAQEAAIRTADVTKIASPEAEVRPLWHRIFRRRAGKAT
jgi:hypothetical protein